MNENNEIIVLKNDWAGLKLLSKGVVVCLEMISNFSSDGKYLSSDDSAERMSVEQVDRMYQSLYSELTRLRVSKPKKLQKMSPKQILKMIRPAHSFIVGIYRNGTPNYRFISMRADKSVADNLILEQFAIEFKNSLIQGVADYVANFTKDFCKLDEMLGIKFRDLKPFITRLERLSICMEETHQYENFIRLRDVPDTYDEYYLYGIGMIESEFYQIAKYEYSAHRGDGELVLLPCIEIVLSETPRID